MAAYYLYLFILSITKTFLKLFSTFTLCSSSRIIWCGQHVLKTPGNTVFSPQEAGWRPRASFQEQKS